MIRSPEHRRWIIVVLGFLSATNPLSTDMYLPAFQEIARDLHTTTASLSLTLSSYFIGIGVGQIVYGPLLDRFGRKKPLYLGLSLYIIASIGCIFSHSLWELVAWRFFSAVGGCVATVVSMAMVRDLFTMKESTKVFSLLMLVLGISPLLAPSIGSFVATHIGWHGSFMILIFLVGLMMIFAALILPESCPGDTSVQIKLKPIFHDYGIVFSQPQFFTYALIGGFSFASLLAFVAASPAILFTFFKVSIYSYGFIFTSLAAGYISGSQVNLLLLRHFHTRQVLHIAIVLQLIMCLTLTATTWMNWVHLPVVFLLLFGMLLAVGCVSPNATALAMAPFEKNAGRASALFNTIQIFLGTIASIVIGILETKTMFPIALVLTIPALIAGCVLYSSRTTKTT